MADPVDINFSPGNDLLEDSVFRWLCDLLNDGVIDFFGCHHIVMAIQLPKMVDPGGLCVPNCVPRVLTSRFQLSN